MTPEEKLLESYLQLKEEFPELMIIPEDLKSEEDDDEDYEEEENDWEEDEDEEEPLENEENPWSIHK